MSFPKLSPEIQKIYMEDGIDAALQAATLEGRLAGIFEAADIAQRLGASMAELAILRHWDDVRRQNQR